jgi:hypothetical protein
VILVVVVNESVVVTPHIWGFDNDLIILIHLFRVVEVVNPSHTNVVISIGSQWMVACLDAIPECEAVKSWCDENQMTLIEINMAQMNDFGANILEVEGKNSPLGVFSETAWKAYDAQQKRALEKFLEPLIVSIPTIETIGGGSARCMMAEIFLP